ncbi:MAG: hypothetical protein JSR33_09875 [Proteobacteria bacterium]|nr:hypothetical protein [Pseudomonadota bacterium]
MKNYLFMLLIFLISSANAVKVNSMYVNGGSYKILHIINRNNSGYIYADNYRHQKILIYKASFPYLPNSVFGSDQIDMTDILSIDFQCKKESNMGCTRFFNRRNDKLSDIYTYILDYDAVKDIVAYFIKEEGLVVISRAFKICKKPLTFHVNLEENSDFGLKTKFLLKGGLQLDYETPDGKDILKIIHPDYEKLLGNCS